MRHALSVWMASRTLCLLTAALLGPPAQAWCQVGPLPGGPAYSKTLWGTVGGGIAGAAVLGGTLALLGEATSDGDGLISPTTAGLIVGGTVGSWLGMAWGGSWGSATDTHRLPTRQLLLPAALWTSAGFAVFGLIGNEFEEDGTPGTDTSWYVGAELGTLVQVVGMSVTTHRSASTESRRASLVSLRVYPSPDHPFTAALHVRLGHP